MAFLKDARKIESGQAANQMIKAADSAIVILTKCKDDLLGLKAAMIANTTDYTTADVTELNTEINRLAALIEAIV